MKHKQLKDFVKNALEINVYLRDSDHKLVAWVWESELKDEWDPDILHLLNTNRLTNWESIARCRRSLQAEHEELRGANWDKRLDKAVEVGMEMTQYTPEL